MQPLSFRSGGPAGLNTLRPHAASEEKCELAAGEKLISLWPSPFDNKHRGGCSHRRNTAEEHWLFHRRNETRNIRVNAVVDFWTAEKVLHGDKVKFPRTNWSLALEYMVDLFLAGVTTTARSVSLSSQSGA